jgi:xanthine dehydrogenase accessory factor
VVIIGAVHVAQALAPMVALAGYQPLVVDPRTAFATAARFPGIQLLPAWPEAALPALGLDPRTALVALSHDPRIDEPALAAALTAGAFYVGALGSRRTHAARCERLVALGLAPAQVARICGPVGLPIGAESPGEIAAAILAELVAHLRRPGQG